MSPFHPEFAALARWLPRNPVGPFSSRVMRALTPSPSPRSSETVSGRVVTFAGPEGRPNTARVFSPRAHREPTALMLWIHGGGFVIGSPAQDDHLCRGFADALGVTVVAPAYRLAPKAPYPAAIDDLAAALEWVHREAASLNGRPDRLVIAGASAGGGLAAGLTLLARDRGVIPIAAQLLVYPMLDDRTVGASIDDRSHRMWSHQSNAFGWKSYLGARFGHDDVDSYAVPARAKDLSKLPPTWIGVGTLDLFHDEDLAYASRLEAAGVPVVREVVPGAFHGFDAIRPRSGVATAFFDAQVAWLREVLA